MKLLKTFSNLQSGFNADGYSYDMPWRKNYEWHCAVFEGIFAFLAGFLILFPVRFFYEGILWYALCFCLFLCLLDSWKGWLMWRRLNNLRGRPLYFMKFSELVSKMEEPGFENDQYLGKGFIWEKRHAQAAYDILRTDYQTAIKDEYYKQKMGMSWIHGIELNESDMWQPLKHVEGHTLITGLPGSGKTRLFDMLISQCIRRGESVLIIDPKGDADMRENARQACKECGCEEQFVFFHPAFPAQSVAIDPLKNFNRTTELASRIKALLPTGGSSESFTSFAWNAVNNVCQGMVYCSIKPSLTKIRAYIEGGVEDLTIQAVKMHARKIDEQVARHQKLKVDKYFGSSYSATL
ncbi:MAG: type IV secretion system DNA-binding domain-containing protein, partial [Burkholderiales bacterium]|nr:type IV secretion system DNA-binding domain-containing protein [Burkholderiales bacterium]